ncbi:hypothetical protein KIL84_013586 [Mauremys mutica]|uniref:Uncharacterized protein n=1 Tax=Mauremys mutica TaxID=74926 RepID=A0A9D3WW76_9SAUR|nr:hypothetical protein KIL84_013586 [Mauremys mutica]
MYNKKAVKLLQSYKILFPSDVETASYPRSKLQPTLEKHHGSAISFHEQHGLGKSAIVLCSTITLPDAIQDASNLKQELKLSKCLMDGLLASNPGEQLSNE